MMDVATKLFLVNGYAGTTVDMIATGALVSKPTLYRLLGDKAAIFTAVIKYNTTQMVDRLASTSVREAPDWPGRLRNFARLTTEAVTTNGTVALIRILIAETPRFPELTRSAAADGMDHVRHFISSGLLALDLPTPLAEVAPDRFIDLVLAPALLWSLLPLRPAQSVSEAVALGLDRFIAESAVTLPTA